MKQERIRLPPGATFPHLAPPPPPSAASEVHEGRKYHVTPAFPVPARQISADGRQQNNLPSHEDVVMDRQQVFWRIPQGLRKFIVSARVNRRFPAKGLHPLIVAEPSTFNAPELSSSLYSTTSVSPSTIASHPSQINLETPILYRNESFDGDLGRGTMQLPVAEAGLAIDRNSIVPYIFEPTPYPDWSEEHDFPHADDVAVFKQSSQHAPHESTELQQEPFPPVQVPGVTPAELAEMWAMLDDETIGYDLHDMEETGADGEVSMPVWTEDPGKLVDGWANLGRSLLILKKVFMTSGSLISSCPDPDHEGFDGRHYPLEEPRDYPTGQAGDQIAFDWNTQAFAARAGQQVDSGPYSMSLPSGYVSTRDRPGHITLQVPSGALKGMSHLSPASTFGHNLPLGPSLSEATSLSPVYPTFSGSRDSNSMPGGGDRQDAFPNRRRQAEYKSPFSAPGVPLGGRTNSSNQRLQPSSNQQEARSEKAFDVNGRRVSDFGLFDTGESPFGETRWESPPLFEDMERVPSYSDYRIPSGPAIAVYDNDFDSTDTMKVDSRPVDQVPVSHPTIRQGANKRGRVVGGAHRPPPQRVTS